MNIFWNCNKLFNPQANYDHSTLVKSGGNDVVALWEALCNVDLENCLAIQR